MSESSPVEVTYSRLNDRYQIVSLIGRGGMASVYKARDEFLGRDVAVKLFDAPSAISPELSRQEHELHVLARLNHHGLVSLIDAGVVRRSDPALSRMYLVMELVRGSTLQDLITRGTLSARQIAQLGTDLAEALEYIHLNGIIHRDVKPANILMVEYSVDGARPRAKLADFGIALLNDAARITMEGATTGTAGYLSPEQALSEEVEPSSDIYSLGLVLLECFTGELAYPGSLIQSAVARLQRPPKIPNSLDPDWRQLLTSMTSRFAADRPPITEVIDALRELSRPDAGRHRAVDPALIPVTEVQRMNAVERYEILDTPPDGAFDRITGLAARLFNVPIAIVSIVDTDRIWFKSHHGLDVTEIGRDAGLCASAILYDEPWVVEDATRDVRAMANPLVAAEAGIQFYAGVPLHTSDGYNLGTLCVLDFAPRSISPEETKNLEDLAALVMSELELRLATKRAVRSAG
ncbi:serine/threonine protein kinase [Glaciihabitans tibetensis]|uniref:Serine/threonine protein kinase n=1 Tax=Glaciihabitans tibetensis TaxID=1266600 RepID=A0A2T0VB41_9MICO|nr:GAF domain-containing serine/threonine-protein kinase [Glaciihabitans tibetensis]PRY67415.1 serine/threonine protein kinase [Glaciihabitans tibetensis]